MSGHVDSIQTKIWRIMIAIMISTLIISTRLAYLQIIQRKALYLKSQKNYLRIEKIRTPRGNILDRNGVLLATNRPSTDLYWRGTGNRRLNESQIETVNLIAQILEKPLMDDQELMADLNHAEHYQKEILLSCDLSFEQLSRILEQLSFSKNIRLETQFKRHYPYKSIASHVIGYLGSMNLDFFGKMGIEKAFEDELRGTEGTRVKTINSFGTRLSETETEKGIAGKDIFTTIDIRMQCLAESLFTDEQQGALIVLDPADGDILALISRPNFDPEIFLQRIQADQWEDLQEKKPFINRACNAAYPPGSIFKLVTASASLEQGIIRADSTCYCKGHVTFCGRDYHCNNKLGHGFLTATQAVSHSCNTLFFEIARHLSIDTLADYAHRFGLGEKTGIIFNEKEGVIPTSAWKRKVFKERWYPGETLSATIGQSFLLVTPIQIACMIGSIFTRQLVTPRITVNTPIEHRPLDVRPETLNFLKQAMRAASQGGTGRRLANIKDTAIYAKTSTAQVTALQKTYSETKYIPHAWVATYVKYKQYKPIVLVVLVENAGSSSIPTTLAKYFILEYQKILDDESYMPWIMRIDHEEDQEELPPALANKETTDGIPTLPQLPSPITISVENESTIEA